MSDHQSGFTVDLEAVRSFGAGLHADLTAHLSPEHDQILRTFVDTRPSARAQQARRSGRTDYVARQQLIQFSI